MTTPPSPYPQPEVGSFAVGTQASFQATFSVLQDPNNPPGPNNLYVPFDPAQVYFRFISPVSATTTTLHYGVDGAITRIQAGVYVCQWTLSEPGWTQARAYTGGTVLAAYDFQAYAIPSPLYP